MFLTYCNMSPEFEGSKGAFMYFREAKFLNVFKRIYYEGPQKFKHPPWASRAILT